MSFTTSIDAMEMSFTTSLDAMELKDALARHVMWLAGESNGKRLSLYGTNLSGADSSDVTIWDAIFNSANPSNTGLRGADLRNAELVAVDMIGADLSGANLSGANLNLANLREANLSNANLCGANLCGANLSGANLQEANLSHANIRGTHLSEANLTGAKLNGLSIPIVSHIDAAILEEIENHHGHLAMHKWHTCETTHCRAGWATTLAGPAGKDLERQLGPETAGALIYAASRPGKPVPDLYATDEAAMRDIRKSAAA